MLGGTASPAVILPQQGIQARSVHRMELKFYDIKFENIEL